MSKVLAVVLSSGGLDSTTAVGLAFAIYGKDNVVTISVSYGQKHDKELKCAEDVANYYGVKHMEIDLSEMYKYSNCALLANSTDKINHGSYAEQIAENETVNTYVPFRNGLMLSSVATIASSLIEGTDYEQAVIMIGAHKDDVAGNAYADCSLQFILSMGRAISLGTYHKVKISAPFIEMSKAGVVEQGLSMNVPYHLTWSCYEGGEEACGTCGTCIDRLKAFEKNNATDPIKYK